MKPIIPALSLLLALSCNLDTAYFKDYEGVNLIGNFPLEDTPGVFGAYTDGETWWSTTSDPDRDPSTTTGAGADPYMNFHIVSQAPQTDFPGETAGAGIPDGSPVARLEIKNLVINGDFETTDLSGWSTNNGADGIAVKATRTSAAVNPGSGEPETFFTPVTPGNNSLWITASTDDWVRLTLSSALTPLDQEYLLRFNFRSYNTLNFALSAAAEAYSIPTQEINDSDNPSAVMAGLYFVPTKNNIPAKQYFAASGGPYTLTLQPSEVPLINMALDDIRLVNVQVTQALSLRVRSAQDTVKPLLRGDLYTFSLAVRDDNPADLTPLTSNAFPAKGLTLTLLYIPNNFDPADPRPATNTIHIPRPNGGWPTWTRVTFDLEPFNTLNFPESYTPQPGQPPLLEIQISPTDTSSNEKMDAGRLLIADPRFVFRER